MEERRAEIIDILLREFGGESLEEALQKAKDYFQALSESYPNVSPEEKRKQGQHALGHIKLLLLWPAVTREIRDLINHGLQIIINYGNEEAEILLTRHQEVCQLLD